tara:strand:- start:3548 stop:3817 length:270 start_codon:yes stop_codon:yes gene_type:complete
MTKELSENTIFNVSVKTLIAIGAAIGTVISMWFMLQADIADAKELPEPAITRIEFDMKDELIRQTIMSTKDDVEEIKEDIKMIKAKLYE